MFELSIRVSSITFGYVTRASKKKTARPGSELASSQNTVPLCLIASNQSLLMSRRKSTDRVNQICKYEMSFCELFLFTLTSSVQRPFAQGTQHYCRSAWLAIM